MSIEDLTIDMIAVAIVESQRLSYLPIDEEEDLDDPLFEIYSERAFGFGRTINLRLAIINSVEFGHVGITNRTVGYYILQVGKPKWQRKIIFNQNDIPPEFQPYIL